MIDDHPSLNTASTTSACQCVMGVCCLLSAVGYRETLRERDKSPFETAFRTRSSITNRCCHDPEITWGFARWWLRLTSIILYVYQKIGTFFYWRAFAKPASLASKNNNKVYLLSSTDVELPTPKEFEPLPYPHSTPYAILASLQTLDLNPTSCSGASSTCV